MSDDVRYYFYHDDQGINRYYINGNLSSESNGHNLTYADSVMVRHRPRPKFLSPTLATYRYKSYDCVPGYGFSRGSPQSYQWIGQWNYVYDSIGVASGRWDTGNDVNSLKLSAGARLTEDLGSFGESLGSLRETGAMVLKRGRQIAQMARDLSRGNWKGLEAQLHNVPGSVKHLPASRRLADGWLELQFGWIPLVSDVYAAVDAYRNKSVRGQSVSSYARNRKPVKGPKGTYGEFGFNQNGRYHNYRGSASVKYYGVVSNPALRTLNQLGLANPLKLAWDLLPYSFVVDWFLPIGQILAYLSKDLGLSQLQACRVTEFGEWKQLAGSGGTRVTVWVTRAPFSPGLFPDLTKLSPRSLGIWHAITGASLVRQSFHR